MIFLVGAVGAWLGCAPAQPPIAPAAKGQSAARAHDAATLPGGEPVLRMPFEAGEVVLCQQGNASAKPLSHSAPNTLHALDLSAPGADGVAVVAAARGRVVRVVTGAKAGDDTPGDGFGNHVVLEHDGAYFTAYSHLGDVKVHLGDDVVVGAPLGTMSNTGKAGTPHLHFSMHRTIGPMGLPDTVPMHALVTAEPGRPFAIATSLELVCAPAIVSNVGRFYASENKLGSPPAVGALDPALAAHIDEQRRAREQAVPPVDSKWVAARLKAVGPEATRRELAVYSAPVARYWAAVVAERDLDDDDDALRRLLALSTDAPPDPVWLMPWVRLRIGGIEARRGHAEIARPLLLGALELPDQGTDYRTRALEALFRLPRATSAPKADGAVSPCGGGTGPEGSVCVASGAGTKGVVVFLHGKYSGTGDVGTRALVAAEAARAGYAVLAAYGERGLCAWEKESPDAVCFPQEQADSVKARALAERIGRAVQRFVSDRNIAGPKLLVGYSNGAFMAAKMLAEDLAWPFDGVGILFGGLSGNALPKRAAGARFAPRVVLASAAADAHHAASMTALASALTDAGHAFAWSSRSGGHALVADDVRRALDLLASAPLDAPQHLTAEPPLARR